MQLPSIDQRPSSPPEDTAEDPLPLLVVAALRDPVPLDADMPFCDVFDLLLAPQSAGSWPLFLARSQKRLKKRTTTEVITANAVPAEMDPRTTEGLYQKADTSGMQITVTNPILYVWRAPQQLKSVPKNSCQMTVFDVAYCEKELPRFSESIHGDAANTEGEHGHEQEDRTEKGELNAENDRKLRRVAHIDFLRRVRNIHLLETNRCGETPDEQKENLDSCDNRCDAEKTLIDNSKYGQFLIVEDTVDAIELHGDGGEEN
jgi:hypothetical protein